MNERFAQICLWTDESISLCKELQQVLSRERMALIAFRGEELTETTMVKEMVVSKILALRKQLRQAANKWYGVENNPDLEQKLTTEQLPEWKQREAVWREEWKVTCTQAERNQEFLKHSQRNLARIIEHWRRQLGEAPLYSAQGKKVDAPSTGKVFQAKF